MTLLDQITIQLQNTSTGELLPVYIDVYDNSLSRKWLTALNDLLRKNYHLEKNYCFFGFVEHQRNAEYLCTQMNRSVHAINSSDLGYKIADFFSPSNTINRDLSLNHDKLNHLHRYFEDLQGVSGAMSPYYTKADPDTRWHIRQLNLLCHEYESLVLSMRKVVQAPEWRRPSQLMCWLNAPRFVLEQEDYELFGIDTISRSTGGVFVGINKAVGKHHWEVFHDEGRDSRIAELTTTTLKAQTEAAGDFDIEWARNPKGYEFQQTRLADFRGWLVDNGFDPEDKSLTIGHPKIGQVDLLRSFGTDNPQEIWKCISPYLDVYKVQTSEAEATYNYTWADPDFQDQQVARIKQGN